MAKSKATKAEDVVENENLEVSDSEKDALKAQEAITAGKDSNQKYKLADPETSYQERDFTLLGEQEKELPESPSSDLIARIHSGFIVKA